MEQVAMNAIQGQEVQTTGTGRFQRGMAMGAVTNMDAFAMIFQQMAEGLFQQTGEGQIPGMETMPQREEEKKNLLSMQELAGLMLSNPEQLDISEVTPEQADALMAAMGQMQAQSTQEAQTAQAGQAAVRADVNVAAAGQELSTAQAQTAAPGQKQTTQNGEKALPLTELMQTEQIVERPITPTDGKDSSLFDGQNRFKSAVEEARKQLSGKKPISEQEMLPTELPTTEAPRQTLFATAEKAERLSQAPKLAEQLENGIKEHLELGKNEFTLKLKPEALGEITVKLVEKGGQTVLTITTASAQTAKLINNDLAALREAVKPMAVEVHEAVQQSSEGAQAQMQQSNFAGQQFAQQQQQQSHSNRQTNGNFFGGLETEEVVEPDQVLEASGLDTYI